ncbi:SCO family protein [Chitinophaga sp. Mgbs1]|uniref:SCO family protein n=1 Tax=Chitinophaga solisilvae TaxID=1233460 RepID=A0A433WBA7_9BACT|nr:SCO family protein [Chitinophaga solisilvae]
MVFFFSTGCRRPEVKLPILGEPVVTQRMFNGKIVYDSIYPTVPTFSLLDQDSIAVSGQSFSGKVYVADFIFLSCPNICPKMTAEMKITYDFFAKDDRIGFISHTIDPEDDSIPRLKAFANSLNIDNRKWKFVTGNQDSILQLAEKGYFSNAYKDSTAPGGYVHSGGLLLIDKKRHIRGVYDGTNPQETYRLINDINILLKEPS